MKIWSASRELLFMVSSCSMSRTFVAFLNILCTYTYILSVCSQSCSKVSPSYRLSSSLNTCLLDHWRSFWNWPRKMWKSCLSSLGNVGAHRSSQLSGALLLCAASLPGAHGTQCTAVLGAESSTLTKRVELIDWSATFSAEIIYVYRYFVQDMFRISLLTSFVHVYDTQQ